MRTSHKGFLSAIFTYDLFGTNKIELVVFMDFYLIVEVLLRETAQKMSVWERLFWVRKEIFSDSENFFEKCWKQLL